MIYKLDELELDLIKKIRDGLKFDRHGNINRNFLDIEDLIEACILLLAMVDANNQEP